MINGKINYIVKHLLGLNYCLYKKHNYYDSSRRRYLIISKIMDTAYQLKVVQTFLVLPINNLLLYRSGGEPLINKLNKHIV